MKQVGLFASLAVGKPAKFQTTIDSEICTRNNFIDLEVKDKTLFHLPYFWQAKAMKNIRYCENYIKTQGCFYLVPQTWIVKVGDKRFMRKSHYIHHGLVGVQTIKSDHARKDHFQKKDQIRSEL